MTRTRLIALWMLFTTVTSAQYMDWSNLTEDSIYYGREYFPDRTIMAQPGPAQIWDFRSLRAPYAISRSIVVGGEKGNERHAMLMNGSQAEAVLELNGNGAVIAQILEDNPVCPGNKLAFDLTPKYKPFFRGVLGEHTSYRGKMVVTFPWPKHINCSFTPPMLPDTCRITYTINEDINVDGEGTVYLPTEISAAHRQHVIQKKAIRIEIRKGLLWRDVTSLVPGIHYLISHEYYRFVSQDLGMLLAEVEVRENNQPIKIEFKTHPMATRIVGAEPNRPDIYAYPNPSFGIVRFQLSDLSYGFYKLKIFNILGSSLKELEVYVDDPRKTITMDLSDLQRGTYLYRLQDSAGRIIKTKRVVLIQS